MTEATAEPKPALSPMTQAVLALVQGLLPAMTAIIGGLWVALTYLQAQEISHAESERKAQDDALTRVIEAQKPFLTKKQETYFETLNISAVLVQGDPHDKSWKETVEKLRAVRYSTMQMVGNQSTRAFLRGVLAQADAVLKGVTLEEKEGRTPAPDSINLWPLRGAVECLADELRRSLAADWSGDAPDGRQSPAPVPFVLDGPTVITCNPPK